jgi:hypothetical protein
MGAGKTTAVFRDVKQEPKSQARITLQGSHLGRISTSGKRAVTRAVRDFVNSHHSFCAQLSNKQFIILYLKSDIFLYVTVAVQ